MRAMTVRGRGKRSLRSQTGFRRSRTRSPICHATLPANCLKRGHQAMTEWAAREYRLPPRMRDESRLDYAESLAEQKSSPVYGTVVARIVERGDW